MGNFGLQELLVVGVIALVIFGPKRLPEMARSLGKAMREFKRATSEMTEEFRSELDLSSDAPKTKEPLSPDQGAFPPPGPR